MARIHETIALEYNLTDGRPQACKGSLVDGARRDELLSEVVRFYLGHFAPRNVMLEANTDLTTKFKLRGFGELVLDTGTEIKVPVPDQWLIDRFARTAVDESND